MMLLGIGVPHDPRDKDTKANVCMDQRVTYMPAYIYIYIHKEKYVHKIA